MPDAVRRLARFCALALLAAVMVSLLPAAVAMGAEVSGAELAAAEDRVLEEMNDIRVRRGQVPLRMADNVRRVAGARSNSMAELNYFAHVAPNGSTAGDLLARENVRHTYWGEAIGWTVGMDLDEAVPWMVDWWRNSPSHFSLMSSDVFNYVGVGVVADGSKLLYTIDFIKGPDHTPPVADLVNAQAPDWGATLLRASTNSVTVSWSGYDPRLVSGTAGLQSFNVQRKLSDGTWKMILWRTSRRQVTLDLHSGEHAFRVRARDRRGNRSQWSEPAIVVVR